jgi:hypothetical protein
MRYIPRFAGSLWVGLIPLISIIGVDNVSAATFSTYTTGSEWSQAARAQRPPKYSAVETFDDLVVDGEVRRGGSVVNDLDPFYFVRSRAGSIQGAPGDGIWSDFLTRSGNTTRWSFSTPVYAWGGVWDLAGPGGPGSGISLELTLVTGGSELLSDEQHIPGDYSGFFGLVSDRNFDTVLVTTRREGAPGINESYTFDNMVSRVGVVPLPASLLLLLSGFGGLFTVGRIRNRAA